MRHSTPKYAEPLAEDQTPRRRTVSIRGQRTDIRVEPMVWSCLIEIASGTDTTVEDLCGRIDELRGSEGLAGAIRLFVLHYYRLSAFAGTADADDDEIFDDGLPPTYDLPPFAPLDADGGFQVRGPGFAEPREPTRLDRRRTVDRALEILFRT
ncbi:ribbon-helix-helix domain-containing protein [Fodinicurvata sp. EGI_FJ10296]|uniref:ribbon-helix-helix domain-containing protein n=1 Tax=Fodinicurvata sp. EGI_FJ10296 TaxID=3231908 RepID=UPI0034560FD3